MCGNASDLCRASNPANDARLSCQAGAHRRLVKREPARPIRRGRVRVNGDHLQIATGPEVQEVVVGAHTRVSAARRWGDPKVIAHPSNTVV
jgi:hypothetical protein